jgi:hypothetical protein
MPTPPDVPTGPDAPAPAESYDSPRASPPESRCDLCSFPLSLERHCKIICPNCGFTRDCSDP